MAIQRMKSSFIFYIALFQASMLNALYYEGVELFRNQTSIELSFLLQFLPYNPFILEVGAFRGEGTIAAAKTWPKSHIMAFEPDPYAYVELQKNTAALDNVEIYNLAVNTYTGSALFNVCLGPNNNEPAYGYASSLLPLKKGMEIYCKGPQIAVPCVTLDSWCESHNIQRIDLLRIEIEGAEHSVLKNSLNTLKKVQAIFIKTYIHPHRIGAVSYPDLKAFLEKSGFVLVSHLYQPDIIGHAVFLSRELFDAYFKRSLGME
jgi:FkbM family methyltransferase